MSTTVWSREFMAHAAIFSTSVASGCSLARTANGFPRISMPLQAAADVSVAIMMGTVSDLQYGQDVNVRVRAHSAETAMTYRLKARFMALSVGEDGTTEAYNVTETTSELMTLPVANQIQDVDLTIVQGDAFDNAAEGDSLVMLLILEYDAGRVTTHPLLVESVGVSQMVA